MKRILIAAGLILSILASAQINALPTDMLTTASASE